MHKIQVANAVRTAEESHGTVQNTGTIYLLENLANNSKPYVGQTNNLRTRISVHKAARTDTAIAHAIRKYGWSSFRATVLHENVPLHELDAIERYCIWLFDSYHGGYNMTLGGEGCRGFKASPETRAKMSAAQKGRPGISPSAETRAKIGAAHRGKVISPETRAKMSAAHLGQKRSPETCARISAAKKGKPTKPHTEEAKAKLRAVHLGQKRSPETCARISASKRAKKMKHTPEAKAKMRESSRIYSLDQWDKVYEVLAAGGMNKDAAAASGIKTSTIATVGSHWRRTGQRLPQHIRG